MMSNVAEVSDSRRISQAEPIHWLPRPSRSRTPDPQPTASRPNRPATMKFSQIWLHSAELAHRRAVMVDLDRDPKGRRTVSDRARQGRRLRDGAGREAEKIGLEAVGEQRGDRVGAWFQMIEQPGQRDGEPRRVHPRLGRHRPHPPAIRPAFQDATVAGSREPGLPIPMGVVRRQLQGQRDREGVQRVAPDPEAGMRAIVNPSCQMRCDLRGPSSRRQGL